MSYKHKQSLALFGMVFFGVGEVVGGLFVGILIDFIGSRRTTILNLVILAITILVTLQKLANLEYNWFTYAMCFAWGFQDAAINIHVN